MINFYKKGFSYLFSRSRKQHYPLETSGPNVSPLILLLLGSGSGLFVFLCTSRTLEYVLAHNNSTPRGVSMILSSFVLSTVVGTLPLILWAGFAFRSNLDKKEDKIENRVYKNITGLHSPI